MKKDPLCPLCGEEPTISEPVDYDAFCGVEPSPAGRVRVAGEVTVEEVSELLPQIRSGNIGLLDVREAFEVTICRIEGAQHIPLGELAGRVGEIGAGRRLLLYCKSGARSAHAVELLAAAGIDGAENMVGGIDRWREEIDPSLRAY